jgi:hypothetical protein
MVIFPRCVAVGKGGRLRSPRDGCIRSASLLQFVLYIMCIWWVRMEQLLDRQRLVVDLMLRVFLHARSVRFLGCVMGGDDLSGSVRPAFSWEFAHSGARIVCCMGSVCSMGIGI